MTINTATLPDTVNTWKWSFSDTIASGIDSSLAQIIAQGPGMAVSQANNSLIITAGTTAYSETIIRSNEPFDLSGALRYGLTLSQRITNNNFVIELVDIVGDDLELLIQSSTVVKVTKSCHRFTAKDIGKGMWIANCSVAACPAQWAVITAVPDIHNIIFSVAGFPGSGTGTCSLFGLNHHQVLYNGVSAFTAGGYTVARKGYRNAFVGLSVNNTAAGHIGIIENTRHGEASFLEGVLSSGGSNKYATRISHDQNVPDGVPLYLQIRAYNSSSAPATSTTLTLSFFDAQLYNPTAVNLAGVDVMSTKNSLPVTVVGTGQSSGGAILTQGVVSHGSSISGNPNRIGARAVTSNYAAVVTGTTADIISTVVGVVVQRPFSIPEQDWFYTTGASPITRADLTQIKLAPGAGLRNYLTSVQFTNFSPTDVETEVYIRDGNVIIWSGHAPLRSPQSIVFSSPLKASINTDFMINCKLADAALHFNAQGYVAP